MNASTARPAAARIAAPAPGVAAAGPRLAAPAAEWPKVSLLLPLREADPSLVIQTLESVAALDYPDLDLLVVDTDTADPALWEPVAEHCARMGPHVRFFHLGPWPGHRAGALNFALRETAPETELVGVLSAGHVLRPRWLRRQVPLFRQPGLGLAQSRMEQDGGEDSPFRRIARAECATHDGDFRGLLPLGALPLFRAEALRGAGGWDESSQCPEIGLGLALLRQGWEAQSSAEPMGIALAPHEFTEWQARRERQVAGGMATLRRQAGALLWPRDRALSPAQRQGLLQGALPPLADMLALAGIALSLGFSAVALTAPEDTRFPLALLPVLLLLALLPGLRVAGHGPHALLGSAALSWRSGRAAWRGLLGGRVAQQPGARVESILLLSLGLMAAGIALANPWGASRTAMWVGLLAVQALPGVAALAVASLGRRRAVEDYAGAALRRHMA